MLFQRYFQTAWHTKVTQRDIIARHYYFGGSGFHLSAAGILTYIGPVQALSCYFVPPENVFFFFFCKEIMEFDFIYSVFLEGAFISSKH